MAKQLPLQAQRPVSIKDAKGRPLSQTDTPARPSAEHSAHATATPAASHRGSHACLSSMQHTARLPVSRPAWLPHRSGSGVQRIFDVGVNQALTARDSSVVTWRWWSRSTNVQREQVTFGSDNYSPISLMSLPTSSSSRMVHRLAVRRT